MSGHRDGPGANFDPCSHARAGEPADPSAGSTGPRTSSGRCVQCLTAWGNWEPRARRLGNSVETARPVGGPRRLRVPRAQTMPPCPRARIRNGEAGSQEREPRLQQAVVTRGRRVRGGGFIAVHRGPSDGSGRCQAKAQSISSQLDTPRWKRSPLANLIGVLAQPRSGGLRKHEVNAGTAYPSRLPKAASPKWLAPGPRKFELRSPELL